MIDRQINNAISDKKLSEKLKKELQNSVEDFTPEKREFYKQIIKKRMLVNGEYYVDSCINEAIKLGYKCYFFEIDQLISWGTPDELKTFEYWQSCFHKWKKHPYDINLDNMIPSNKKSNLISNYMRFNKNSF